MQTIGDREIDESKEPVRSDDNNTFEVVRIGLREAALTKRKKDRISAWNKNRTGLGESIENAFFPIDYVNERARFLKRKRISLEDYRYLPNALIQREENIDSFLNVDQSLSGLIRDLSGNNPVLQLYAANCCCNIALGNVKACTALGKAVIPYLLTELESLNYALLDVCIWTIGNLIAGSGRAFSILHAQHCLKHLILLLNNCDNAIYPSVIYAVLHYVYIGFHDISDNEMSELVQATVKRSLLYKDSNFVWLLALLSSSTVFAVHPHFLDSSILSQVVDYLHHSGSDETADVNEITASIRILANALCNSYEDKIDILLRNPKYSQEDLCALFDKLLSHRYVHIRKEALWLIGNLYNHRLSRIGQSIKDIVPFSSSLDQAILSIGNYV
ncbi:importin subunit alpha-9 [Harpegnathos saltator]|nr:importin subunit alpha-9 [Harpegnathos saltator]XP_011147262.1 importin subunit alpha-9 [Harpegnathos saltator]XP_011147263.1 importin subunit alpha-9 [Harpegnathos saltator]XP_025159609.1 importin subunit alpha-9 [Harpegnathos saltator]XP_025159610.1 importin subunit alpha-9 [Harpegnathos saltator]XP_025159611.1 importin subunit alpha-9 [Harpegnathos saltator]